MQSELIQAILDMMNTKLLGLSAQLILTGAILLYLKDLSGKILDFIKLKFGDFGRGTKLEIGGKIGYIMHVGFNEVEIEIDEQNTFIVPVHNFIKSNKVIIRNRT